MKHPEFPGKRWCDVWEAVQSRFTETVDSNDFDYACDVWCQAVVEYLIIYVDPALWKRVRKAASSQPLWMHVNEARLLAELSHPCLVRLLGVLDAPGRLDVLLEYCPDGELSAYARGQPGRRAVPLWIPLLHENANLKKLDLFSTKTQPIFNQNSTHFQPKLFLFSTKSRPVFDPKKR